MMALVAVTVAMMTTSCRDMATYRITVGYELHTPYHIKYRYNRQLDKEIRDIFADYYHSINAFDSTSIISQVNRNEEVELDPIFLMVYNKAQEVAEATDGILDVTCAPLINLWGFGFKHDMVISDESLEEAMQIVGYQKVHLEDGRIIKENPDIIFNFSALGDGCSCDLIAEFFESLGIEDYCIEIGGEIEAAGHNPNGEPWRVGIVKPVEGSNESNQEINQIVEISEKRGLATSGNYRNFREATAAGASSETAGTSESSESAGSPSSTAHYGHEIDPRTGRPATTDVLSATVIMRDCITADAYATAFVVMGSDAVETFARDRDDIAYLLICATPTTCTCATCDSCASCTSGNADCSCPDCGSCGSTSPNNMTFTVKTSPNFPSLQR